MSDEYLKAAAEAVEKQVLENPGLGIPVDPDVAEFMGCFVEEAVSLEDIEADFEEYFRAGPDGDNGAD